MSLTLTELVLEIMEEGAPPPPPPTPLPTSESNVRRSPRFAGGGILLVESWTTGKRASARLVPPAVSAPAWDGGMNRALFAVVIAFAEEEEGGPSAVMVNREERVPPRFVALCL